MPLDLNALSLQVRALNAEAHKRAGDLDTLQSLPLTPNEQAVAAQIQDDYRLREHALVVLIDAIEDAAKLGLPVLPTLNAPQSMLDHIEQILSQIRDAESLLLAELIAATVKVQFSAPQPK